MDHEITRTDLLGQTLLLNGLGNIVLFANDRRCWLVVCGGWLQAWCFVAVGFNAGNRKNKIRVLCAGQWDGHWPVTRSKS